MCCASLSWVCLSSGIAMSHLLSAGAVCMTLPETMGLPLPDSMADIRNQRKRRSSRDGSTLLADEATPALDPA